MKSPVLAHSAPELGIGPWPAAVPPGSGIAFIDAAVADQVLPGLPQEVTTALVDRTADLDAVRAAARLVEWTDPVWVLGIGGGATMDLAKLAAAAAERPRLVNHLAHATRRCGHVQMSQARRRRHLLLVPTTVGTGSESSHGACFDHPLREVEPGERARTLVTGTFLAANQAWLDPQLLTTLPHQLVREGVLEALSRVLVSTVCSPSALEPPEWEAQMLIDRLLDTLDRLTTDHPDRALLELAAIASTMTHRGMGLAGRGSAPSPVWFVATELSMVTRTRKNEALSALVAHWTRVVADGHSTWGDPDRLAAVWPLANEDPIAVIRRWRLQSHLTCPAGTSVRVAERVEQRWGGRLPMMGRFTRADLLTLLNRAVTERGD
ncbi:iron-containing alcohol dehydrogenase [Actinomyces sp. 2119]|uniref:iron-containing alcohol dehydrogenase n=1 Tax=Actinomyces sp. 2119 TaxID=2321393 RepID=UPI000E6B51FF|nr:iron-containing alcohol dehydrogenase [Actinomyces sp. 2119]RJF43800.1 iron-containing alcohol dehydrogenase [Actinomyces sp. 2119]